MEPLLIFEFSVNSDLSHWKASNDAVMRGKSESIIYLNSEGNGVFEGEVSLENNGGFCAVKFAFTAIALDKSKRISIRIKGDGKEYQIRVKTYLADSHSHVYPFKTSRDRQTIEIPITAFYPSFRGRKLEIPNYDGSNLEEMAFLIGNKKTKLLN